MSAIDYSNYSRSKGEPTTTTPWLLSAFQQNLKAMERYPSILPQALTARRKELNRQVVYQERWPFRKALDTFATQHRLTWDGERYVEALSDYELEQYLLNERNWPSLNHFIEKRYAVGCMSRGHKVMLWEKAKALGADWDKEKRRFKARRAN